MSRKNCSHCSGAATSAAKVNGKTGIHDAITRVFIPGEGWVKWTDIQKQVAKAYDEWRARCAVQGRYIFDGAEARASQITDALSRRGVSQ